MTKREQIQLFEDRRVRTVWDDEQEKWYFSIVDVVEVLTDSADPTDYLKKMRKTLAAEGGGVARTARMELEAKTGKGVISPENARAVLDGRKNPELSFDEEE